MQIPTNIIVCHFLGLIKDVISVTLSNQMKYSSEVSSKAKFYFTTHLIYDNYIFTDRFYIQY